MIKLAWIDDDLRLLAGLEDYIKRNFDFIEMVQLPTLASAREYFESETPDGAVFDMRMTSSSKAHNADSDGSQFLFDVCQQNKTMPAFVYSEYLNDDHYAQNIEKSYVDLVIRKNQQPIRKVFEEHGDFHVIAEQLSSFSRLRGASPNDVSLTEYLQSPEAFKGRLSTHWDLNGKWIAKEMQRNNYAWCVVCGFDVVSSSTRPIGLPTDDELMKIGKHFDRVPFRYGADYLPEETTDTSWNPTSIDAEDFYPAVRVRVNSEFDADFDTGSYRTFVPDTEVPSSLFDFFKTVPGNHLGQEFKKISKPVELELLLEDGSWESITIDAEVVENWRKSPFVKVNPDRKMLLGRDVFGRCDIEISLDGKQKSTRVRKI